MDEFFRSFPAPMRRNVSGASLTTFGIGGPIDYLIEPQTIDELGKAITTLHAACLPWQVLGAGSNLLIADGGVSSPVIRLGRDFSRFYFLNEKELTPEGTNSFFNIASQQTKSPNLPVGSTARILVFGAASLMSLSRKLSQDGFSGLEFAAGIPASLGGAVRMNAGAHGHAMEEIVETVVLFEPNGSIQVLTHGELKFSYRQTSLPEGSLVLGAVLSLKKGDPREIAKTRADCLEYRKRTQPLHLPSAGSVFKNPSPDELVRVNINSQEITAAAQLLEIAGFKGFRFKPEDDTGNTVSMHGPGMQGAVEFSKLHANWLVRTAPEAQAAEAIRLMEKAEDEVHKRFGLSLRREIIFWNS